MTTYAAQTDVSADRSRAEIEATLTRYGADQFMYGWDQDKAVIGFRAEGRQVRFVLVMPDKGAPEFTQTPTGRQRKPAAAHKEWEQATRQRWRALALVVKAKLEAVESGISGFEDEFLANIVLPNGSTVAEFMSPQIAEAYSSGAMPSGLPALEAG